MGDERCWERWLPKNTQEKLIVSLDRRNGHDLVALRVWSNDGARRGNNGIAINVKKLAEMRALLDAAEAEAKKIGWL